VAHNIAALGGQPSVVGVVGDDPAGRRLTEAMRHAGIDVDGLVADPARPTTEKVRIVTERNQQVARVDYELDADVTGAIERSLVERAVKAADADVVLVSDYLKGVVTRPLMEALLHRASDRKAPVIVDPKIPHLACYAGATLITPNHLEAETAVHRRIRNDDDAREAAVAFRMLAQSGGVLITRGEHGMWLSAGGADTAIPAIAREVSDVTGAGDTVVATLALAIAAGASPLEAAVLANHAAGVVVGKFGAATVAADELLRSLSAGSASGR
jgi:D-glycero-beta-D-manno-heptose-7-phosphate kinase